MLQQYLAKLAEADAVLGFLSGMVPGAVGRLNSIGPERAAMIQTFLNEMAAHPEFMPSFMDPAHAPAKAAIYNLLKRAVDRRNDSDVRLAEALARASDDLLSDFSDYYSSAQACAKRNITDASTTVSNLAPFMKKGIRGKKAAPKPVVTGK